MSVLPGERGSGRGAATTLGLVFALGVPCLPLSRWEHEFASVGHLLGYEALWWTIVVLLLAHVHFIERRTLASLGAHRVTRGDLVSAMGAGVAIVVGLATIYAVVFPLMHVTEQPLVDQLRATPAWWLAASVVRAAVSEEVLFRGYAISRLQAVTRRLPVAAALSWAVFTVAHVPVWGWSHLLVAGVGGAGLTLAFLWRRNLWVSIIAHAIVDGAAVLAA